MVMDVAGIMKIATTLSSLIQQTKVNKKIAVFSTLLISKLLSCVKPVEEGQYTREIVEIRQVLIMGMDAEQYEARLIHVMISTQ